MCVENKIVKKKQNRLVFVLFPKNWRLKTQFEPPCGKTNNVVSEQVWHKSGCTVTEAGYKLEISDLRRKVSVLSV